MVWTEIGADGIWTIPAERYKTKRSNHVPLSNAALAVIEAQPKIGGCDYVFPSRSETPFSGFGKSKAKLDEAVLRHMLKRHKTRPEVEPLPNWTLHDLRRTMRTGLSALPIPDRVRELVIAHAQPGLHKVYDQFGYENEKRHALELWAARLMTYNAARLKDARLPFLKEAAMTKYFCSQVAERVASEAVEVYGGYGFTKDYPVEKYLRDSKIGKIYEGTSFMQLQTIAKVILGG